MATTAHDRVSRAWEDYSRGGRLDVGLRCTDILRASYPGAHVVRVQPPNCDLEGFAAAGFAKWFPESTLDAMRTFSAPGPRLDKDPGKLVDNIKFGRARYIWKDTQLIVYEVSYQETLFSQFQTVLFVLGDDAAAIDALLLECGRWTKELHEEIYIFDQALWSKSKSLYLSVHSASWDDVILDEDTKANLIDDVQGFFDKQELYKSFNVPWKRGIILHGVPGNGKTISIKALINALSSRKPEAVPSLYVKNFDDHCNGPKYSIQTIFRHARSMAPCLLIFEDLDSMVTDKVRSYFLNEVDGIESNDGILMIGSTNHLDRLDPAITKRPSRFDRKYHFKVPNEHDRTLYCRYWHQKMADNPRIDFPDELCPILAKLTQGFSFAYLKELFVTSLLLLVRAEPLKQQEAVGPESCGSSSSTDVVVVPSLTQEENVLEKTGEDKSKGKQLRSGISGLGEKESSKDVKPKRSTPVIEVPDSLQSNKLLAVMKEQAQLLLDEMNNTDDRSAAKVRPDGSDSEDSDGDSD